MGYRVWVRVWVRVSTSRFVNDLGAEEASGWSGWSGGGCSFFLEARPVPPSAAVGLAGTLAEAPPCSFLEAAAGRASDASAAAVSSPPQRAVFCAHVGDERRMCG